MEGLSIAAVDDHPVMLSGLRTVIASGPRPIDLRVTARTVDELLETLAEPSIGDADAADGSAEAVAPQLVLLDLKLKDGSRPRDNVRRLRAAGLEVLVYTEGGQPAWITDAVAAGAIGVVLKDQDPSELAEAVWRAHDGEPVMSTAMAGVLESDAVLRPQLSQREQETLRLVAHGLGDRQVARQLGLAEDTVKVYLKRIRAKYAEIGRVAGTRVELARRAREDGLTD